MDPEGSCFKLKILCKDWIETCKDRLKQKAAEWSLDSLTQLDNSSQFLGPSRGSVSNRHHETNCPFTSHSTLCPFFSSQLISQRPKALMLLSAPRKWKLNAWEKHKKQLQVCFMSYLLFVAIR